MPSVNHFEEKIKSMVGMGGFSKWAEAPDHLKIRDENGNISEDFIKQTQGMANSQKQIQQELSIKFNQHLSSTNKTI